MGALDWIMPGLFCVGLVGIVWFTEQKDPALVGNG